MRVLFTVQPAHGHVNPMLGLSRALRDAGHEVLFATSAPFVPQIEVRGERAAAVGVEWLESDGAIEPAPPDDPTGARTIFRRLFLGEVAATAAADLVDLIDEYEPDVVLRESFEFGGSAAAERCEVPLATFDLSFPSSFEVMVTTGDVEDAGPLEALRAHVGLPPATDDDWFLGDLRISTFPDRYQSALAEPADVVIRPSAIDLVDDVTVPEWVEELDDAIYVSFGTVFPRWFPEVVECAASGAAATGRSTVVTLGPSVTADELDLPDTPNLVVADYLPQGPVLDRCAAAVIHGGTGTTLGALARGVPLVMIPMGADQFGHANTVERLGAGLQLALQDLTPTAVSEALEALFDDPAYQRSARTVGDDLLALPGPEQAIPALEALADQQAH